MNAIVMANLHPRFDVAITQRIPSLRLSVASCPRTLPCMSKSTKTAQPIPTPKLDAWCAGKPYIIRWLGLLIAHAAPEIQFGINAVRSGAMRRISATPESFDKWLALYEPMAIFPVIEAFTDIIANDHAPKQNHPVPPDSPPSDLLAEAIQLFPILLDAATAKPDEVMSQELKNALAIADDYVRKGITAVHASSKNQKAILNPIEMTFLATVWLPCFLVRRQTPDQLFLLANGGDFNALNDLVRFDPLVIHAPSIRQHLAAASRTRQADHKRIMRAITSHPFRRHSGWAVKADLGGFLLAAASGIKFRLTKTDIVALFNAYAIDYLGRPRDEDIPADQETYRKQLFRRRDQWSKFLTGSTNQMLELAMELASASGTEQNI